MRAAIITIAFVLNTWGTVGQQFDVAGFSYIFNPNVGLKDPRVPELEDLDLNVSEFKAFLLVPSRLKNEKTTLLNGLHWHYVKTPFEDFPNNVRFEANLHSIRYTFGLVQEFTEKWTGLVMLRPTLASNFKDGISSDDFYFQGNFLARYSPSGQTHYGLGVAYINGFGEPAVIPLLAYQYESDQLRINLLAPIEFNLALTPGTLQYGIQAELEGGEFHLSSKPGDGPIITNLDSIRFSRYNIGPFFGWVFSEQFRFETSAGIAIKRTLKTVGTDGMESDFDLKGGLFLKVGIYLGAN